MFFVRLGQVVSWVALILGTLRLASAVFIGMQDDPEFRAGLIARYIGSGDLGRAIDYSVYVIGFAIVLGILVHIARSVDKR